MLRMIGRAAFTALAVALGACGDGTSPLAKGAGAGGAGGDAAGGGGSDAVTTTTTTGSGGSGGIEEPAGPTRVTIVDGIVDADAIRVCFLGDAPSTPVPGPEGIAYAAAAVVDPPAGEVEMVVLAGDLAATAGASCDDLVSDPPAGVVARSLGIFPDGVFEAERSILLVPNGCVGGDDHTDPLEASICGAGYEPTFGNASVLAGFMSRIAPLDKVALQFAQASAAMPAHDLRVRSNDVAPPQLVVAKWSIGAVAPFPPYTALSKELLLTPGDARVGVYEGAAQDPIFEVAWSVAFDNGPLTAADVTNGRGLVFVAIGPAPTLTPPSGAWWKPHTYTAVLADPE